MTNKIEFPLWLNFHLAAPNNKIVIKKSYQLDFNSKHFQKTVPKSQLISLQQPPNCSKLVVKGKKKKTALNEKDVFRLLEHAVSFP